MKFKGWNILKNLNKLINSNVILIILSIMYMSLWGYIGYNNSLYSDLDIYFIPATIKIYDGHPFLLYTYRFGINPIANGPLSFVPLYIGFVILTHLGWLDIIPLRHAIIMLIFAPFTLLFIYETGLIVQKYMRKDSPFIIAPLYIVIAISPPLWIGVAYYGHIELPLTLWLTMKSIRKFEEGQIVQSGRWIGLGMLARSTTIMYIISFSIILWIRGDINKLLRYLCSAIVIIILGLFPFFISTPSNTLYSLVAYHSFFPIRGGSIAELVVGTPLKALFLHWDLALILVFVALLSLIFSQRIVAAKKSFLFEILVIVSICFPLFTKTVWPYYLLDPYVFVTMWAISNMNQGNNWNLWIGLIWDAALTLCTLLLNTTIGFGVSYPNLLIVSTLTSFFLVIIAIFMSWTIVKRSNQNNQAY